MGEQVAALIWGCSSVGRAPALQAGGHEFESHHLHEGIEPCRTSKHWKRRACTEAYKDLMADRAIARDEKGLWPLNRTDHYQSLYTVP